MKTIVKNSLWAASVLLVSMGLIVSCSDDNLDVSNPNQLGAANFFTTFDNVNNALTGVYEVNAATELYGFNFMARILYALPKTEDYAFTSNSGFNEFGLNEVTDGNELLATSWRSFYRGVARANDFLSGSERFRTTNDLTPERNARILEMQGEAYWLRAMYYFHLIRLWGEGDPATNPEGTGVPLITQVASSREEMNMGKATVGAIYEQMISDLQEAESRLPDTWDTDNIARVDAIAAKALLGQVYTYQQNYSAARPKFEEVINSGLSLVPMDDYDDLFHGKNEFSSESIFEINFSRDENMNAFNGGPGSTWNTQIAPPGTGFANYFPHDENIRRFGDDPRLRVAALEPGIDTITLRDGNKDVLPRYVEDEGALAWSFGKYASIDFASNGFRNDSGANIFLLRLADVYLMYAEVLNALGEDGAALEALNTVRSRAFENSSESGELTGLSGTALRDAIREERFLELFGEGVRWFDIRRWGIIEEEIAKYPTTRVGTPSIQPQDAYLPIPLDELNRNTAIEQNTGY